MNLKDYYWYFDSVLPHKFCDELIKYGNTKKEELGLIGEISEKNASGKSLEDRDFQDLKKKRDSNVVWLSDRWIYREIHPYVHEANKLAGWNFDYRNKIRKLSVTCQLSDSSEYEGGELEFQYRNKDNPNMVAPCEQAKKKGSIIVFPSFVWHRVKPVTKGTRYSLVIWNLFQKRLM